MILSTADTLAFTSNIIVVMMMSKWLGYDVWIFRKWFVKEIWMFESLENQMIYKNEWIFKYLKWKFMIVEIWPLILYSFHTLYSVLFEGILYLVLNWLG